MADSFSLRVTGQDEVETFLAGLLGRVDDLAPLMDIIGQTLETDAQDNFLGEHSPAGVPWKPSGRVRKTAVGKSGPQTPTGKTLQDSRRLFQSMTHGGPGHISVVSRSSVEVGTNVIYARRHNQGWSGTEQVAAHKRTMRMAFGVKLAEPKEVMVKAFSRQANTPQREFLGMSIGAREDILGQAEDYLAGSA